MPMPRRMRKFAAVEAEQARARWSNARSEPTDSELLPVLTTGGCWCGKKINHDWLGKDQDAPHPREEES